MNLVELLRIEDRYLSRMPYVKLSDEWHYEREDYGFKITYKDGIGGIVVDYDDGFDQYNLIISRLYIGEKEHQFTIEAGGSFSSFQWRNIEYPKNLTEVSDIHYGLNELLEEVFGY